MLPRWQMETTEKHLEVSFFFPLKNKFFFSERKKKQTKIANKSLCKSWEFTLQIPSLTKLKPVATGSQAVKRSLLNPFVCEDIKFMNE